MPPGQPWPDEAFARQLRAADSAAEVRKVWHHFAAHQMGAGVHPAEGPIRSWLSCGFGSVVDNAGIWSRALTRDALAAARTHGRWGHLTTLARRNILTPENIAPLLRWASKQLRLNPHDTNSEAAHPEPSKEASLMRVLSHLVERDLIPQDHPLRESLLARFKEKNLDDLLADVALDTPSFQLHQIIMLLGDIDIEYVCKERNALRKALEDTSQYFSTLHVTRIESMYFACVRHLCLHDEAENFTQHWQPLSEYNLDRALDILEDCAARPPEQLSSEALRPLLNHSHQEVRQLALRLLGRAPQSHAR